MPNKDGTGPNGLGPQTGKRLGRCFANFNNLVDKESIDENDSFISSPISKRLGCCGQGRGRRCRPVQEN